MFKTNTLNLNVHENHVLCYVSHKIVAYSEARNLQRARALLVAYTRQSRHVCENRLNNYSPLQTLQTTLVASGNQCFGTNIHWINSKQG